VQLSLLVAADDGRVLQVDQVVVLQLDELGPYVLGRGLVRVSVTAPSVTATPMASGSGTCGSHRNSSTTSSLISASDFISPSVSGLPSRLAPGRG
jgi:hypothetical protein